MAARRAVAALVAFGLAGPVVAQTPPPIPFLVLDQERILTGSAPGRALLADEEAARERLRREARAIEAAFEAEERRLTDQRAETETEAFRALADDFDARVLAARRDQDARASALALEFDQRRRAFYADVAPILVGVMENLGAFAILDESSVLLSDQALNITDEVIAEMDRLAVDEPPAPEGAGAADAPPAGGTD